MNAIMCELCGSNDVVKQGEYFVCQHCGTKYSLEDARKLIGTVKIDNSDELDSLYILARRAKEEGNIENAQKYYDMIILKNPNSWEAQFYSIYYKCAQCTTDQVENASLSLANCLENVMKMIKENIDDENMQLDAINEVRVNCSTLVTVYEKAIWTANYEMPGCTRVNPGLLESSRDEKVCIIITRLCLAIKHHFDINNTGIASIIQSLLAEEDARKTQREQLREQVKSSAEKRNGCYVATAVYGSYDCPQVWTLRRYRDYTLAETWFGRLFIALYYAISPTLVKWFGETQWFKNLWKPRLDKMVKRLNDEGVADTPYQDRRW